MRVYLVESFEKKNKSTTTSLGKSEIRKNYNNNLKQKNNEIYFQENVYIKSIKEIH